jgi:streptogramin lyase
MRGKSAILLMSLVSVACTVQQGPATPPLPRSALPSGEFLLLDTAGGIGLMDVATGELLDDFEGAVATPDGSALFRARGDGSTTRVDRIDPATGEIEDSTVIRGDLTVRTVSSSGHVALMSTPPDTWVPRRRTTIVVLDSGSGDVERFTLPGNFEPEAFSTRARGLFALRYQPALVPTTYRVTQLRLRSGDVRPVYGPSKVAKVVENMTATRVHHAMSPGENVLYTLYTNQPPDFLADSADVDPEHALAFIHTLDLRNGTAVCIGLPKSFGTVSRAASALAASPVGTAVYAIDARGGTVASMIGRAFTVEEHRVDLSVLGRGPVSARVSSDGESLFIAGAAGILALDTETFEPLPFAPTPAPVTGIALSGDGDLLFASWDGGIGLLEPTTLATVGIVPSPVPGAVTFVGAA